MQTCDSITMTSDKSYPFHTIGVCLGMIFVSCLWTNISISCSMLVSIPHNNETGRPARMTTSNKIIKGMVLIGKLLKYLVKWSESIYNQRTKAFWDTLRDIMVNLWLKASTHWSNLSNISINTKVISKVLCQDHKSNQKQWERTLGKLMELTTWFTWDDDVPIQII